MNQADLAAAMPAEPKRNLTHVIAEKLGIEPWEVGPRAKLAGWDPQRFRDHLEDADLAEAFRRDLEVGIQAWAEAGAGRVLTSALQRGPHALAQRTLAELDAMLRRTPRLAALATDYDPSKHGGRLVLGPTGCGKSVAGVRALRGAVVAGLKVGALDHPSERRGFGTPTWLRALDLPLERLQTSFGEGEGPLVSDAKQAHMLFLDDVGWESRRAGADDVISEVIASRYDSGFPTYVTSGLTLAGFTERYGDAIIRRIVECGGLPGKVVDLWPRETKQ